MVCVCSKTLGEFKETLRKLLMPRTPSEVELFKQEQREQYEKKQLEEQPSRPGVRPFFPLKLARAHITHG